MVKSPAARKIKRPPSKRIRIGKKMFTKRQIGIVCGMIAALGVALVITLIFVFGRSQSQAEPVNDTGIVQDGPVVDYAQKITDRDGSEFKAEYQAGSEQSFAMRFADLKCEDDCKNVSEVKLGDKVLKQGEDYKVESGSIIVILTESFMKSLKADEYDLVIAVVDVDETSFYGVKFMVKPEPTCGEGEVLEKGECVKKPAGAEQPAQGSANNTVTKPSNNQSTAQPSQPSQQPSAQQTACERRAGPVAFLEVSYLTPEQKQAWIDERGASSDIVALVMQSNFQGATKMVWKNGRCQPSFGNAMAIGGINQPFNMAGLPAKAQANPNRNAVIWLWEDGGEEIEFVSDPYTFIYNHE